LAAGGSGSATAAKNAGPKEFSIEVDAKSASWAKRAGSTDLYTLTLAGVSKSTTVRTLMASKKTSTDRFPVRDLPAYWDAYGERSGQFTRGDKAADAPLVVLAMPRSNNVVLAKLHELKSSSASKLVYSARVLPDTALARRAISKIVGRRSLGFPSLAGIKAVRTPRSGASPRVFIDMPSRMKMPTKASTSSRVRTTKPTAHASDILTCDGVYSSDLSACVSGNLAYPGGCIGNQCSCQNLPSMQQVNGNYNYWYYDSVGLVAQQFTSYQSLYSIAWTCQAPGTGPYNNFVITGFTSANGGYGGGWGWGDYYGVGSDWVTYYASSNCTAFLAKWSASGKCY